MPAMPRWTGIHGVDAGVKFIVRQVSRYFRPYVSRAWNSCPRWKKNFHLFLPTWRVEARPRMR